VHPRSNLGVKYVVYDKFQMATWRMFALSECFSAVVVVVVVVVAVVVVVVVVVTDRR